MDKRKLDVSIISDVHLGTYESHPNELLKYLRSIQPKILILNGGFINSTKLDRHCLSKEHLSIINEIKQMANDGVKVYVITHDRTKILDNFFELSSNLIHLREKLDLRLKNKSYLIFHGANIASISKKTPFIMKPGSKIYDLLLKLKKLWKDLSFFYNKKTNHGIISARIKKSEGVIKCFEESVVQIAESKNYDYVVCGYIHEPVIKELATNNKSVVYMNAGDWVENLTALEYRFEKWNLYEYDEIDYGFVNPKLTVKSKTEKARFSA